MKKINLVLCFLILISFSFVYNPVTVNASENISFSIWEDYNITAKINNNTNFINGTVTDLGAVYLNSGIEPYVDINLSIVSSWPYVNGQLYPNLVNPKGVNFYVVMGYCTTEPNSFFPDFGLASDVTNHFKFVKFIYSDRKTDCWVDGYKGKIVHTTIEVTAIKTTETQGSGQFITTGVLRFRGNRFTTYNNITKIQYIQVFRSTNKELEIAAIQEQIKDDNRNILQRLSDLPNDLWNFIKNIPGQVWSFFSGAFDTVTSAIVSIGNFILDLPGNIWNGLKTGFNWITDGLVSLGSFILDGLKDLFIPSNLSVDNLVTAFRNKLGFIYDVPYSVISYGLNLSNLNISEMNSVHIPSINIFGYNFWGSQNIDISSAIDTFKPYRYLTSISCVVICVNTLFKYKDKIFGSGGGDYK